MNRIILTYGLISGLVIISSILGTLLVAGDASHSSVWLGYLIMLVALSAILVGVRQYRDQALGGVITFRTAALMGLGIAMVASATYVVVWEIYLAATDYAFMPKYAAQALEAKRAAGVTGAEYAKFATEMAAMVRQYTNPLIRLPMTFVEIFPVGLLVALVSAALLRNPRFLPATAKAA